MTIIARFFQKKIAQPTSGQSKMSWPDFSVLKHVPTGRLFQKRRSSKAVNGAPAAELWPLDQNTSPTASPNRQITVRESSPDYTLEKTPLYAIGDKLETKGGRKPGIVRDITYDTVGRKGEFVYILEHNPPEFGETNDWYESDLDSTGGVYPSTPMPPVIPMKPWKGKFNAIKPKMHDMVKILHSDDSPHNVGKTGQVVAVDDQDDTVRVELPNDKFIEWYGSHEVEVVNAITLQPKFKVGDRVLIHPLETPENGEIILVYPPDKTPDGGIWYDVKTDSGQTEPIDEESVRLLPRGQAQPSQQQQTPSAAPMAKQPFNQRMNDVLRRLQVSPTDKQTKKDYEDLLIEQQEEEMKNVVAKMKRKKK
jgi:hypothetical protein